MPDSKTSFAQGQLKSLVERIERLEEEKATIAGDIKEVYAETKAFGFDTKIVRKLIALRRRDRHEREEEDAILDLYMSALGMLPGTSDEAEEPKPDKGAGKKRGAAEQRAAAS